MPKNLAPRGRGGGWGDRQQSVQSFLLLTSCSLDSKAEETLQKYLQSKEDVIDAILCTDQALTQRERQIEGEAQVKRLCALESYDKFKFLINLGS